MRKFYATLVIKVNLETIEKINNINDKLISVI